MAHSLAHPYQLEAGCPFVLETVSHHLGHGLRVVQHEKHYVHLAALSVKASQ